MTEEQIDELEKLIKSPFFTNSQVVELVEFIRSLQQQNKQLITAIEWYASNKNWGTFEEYGLDIGDGGEHARAVLQQIQGNKP